VVSSVLAATGTTPALIAPRKALGKSTLSWRQSRMRCSISMPSACSAPAKRSTVSATSP
jgi:hypothetical protein